MAGADNAYHTRPVEVGVALVEQHKGCIVALGKPPRVCTVVKTQYLHAVTAAEVKFRLCPLQGVVELSETLKKPRRAVGDNVAYVVAVLHYSRGTARHAVQMKQPCKVEMVYPCKRKGVECFLSEHIQSHFLNASSYSGLAASLPLTMHTTSITPLKHSLLSAARKMS